MAAKAEFLKELDDIEISLGSLNGPSDAMIEVGQSLARLRSLVEQTVKF